VARLIPEHRNLTGCHVFFNFEGYKRGRVMPKMIADRREDLFAEIYEQIKSGELRLPRYGSLPEYRFWKMVDKNGPIHPVHGQCWIWIGSTIIGGYGNFAVGGTRTRAHCYSYQIHVGEVPKGLCVCHKCDNPPCIRPSHLFVGTRLDNHNDMVSKGRRVDHLGTDNGRSKLTEEQVIEIRRRYCKLSHFGRAGTKNANRLYQSTNTKALAKEFGVTPEMIWAIVKGKNWRHV
jgi:HNH endonuclease